MKRAIIGLALLALVGCSESNSKATITGPDWCDIDTHPGAKGVPTVKSPGVSGGTNGTSVPPTHTDTPPVVPPVVPTVDDEKDCNGHHQGGGNDHLDCGKDGKK